jgi:RNA 2',3'-cyclic 3'-phosphodiesterase
LGRLQADLKQQLPPKVVRWTNPEGIHLTLKFLGDTPEGKVQAVTQGMLAAAAGFEPFELRVAGFGCFPNPRRARVLWVGVPDLPKPLAGVQRAIDLQMARLDFARETRPFSPHLTLGRVNDRISRGRAPGAG